MEKVTIKLTESELAELREAGGEDVAAYVKRVALDRARRRSAVQYRPERETRSTS